MPAKPPISRRILLSLGGLALGIGLLGAVEGVLRLATNDPHPGAAEYWEHLLDQTAPCDEARSAGPHRDGTLRLAIVGESSGEFLGNNLKVAVQGYAPVDVVSCGKSASSLEQIEARFEEVRATKPDAVTIVLGHNLEKVFPSDRGKIRLQAWIAKSRLLSLLAGGLREERPGNANVLERLPVLEEFLRRADREAHADGFRLVIATVTPNFWLPPFRDPGDTRPSPGTPAVFEARWKRLTGHPAEAAEGLRTASEAAPKDVHLAFELAETWAEAGDHAHAREAFERALAGGTNRVIQPTNDLLRRVAKETGALLRDMLADSEKRASDGNPGWESVEDNCHLFKPYFRDEGVAIVRDLLSPEKRPDFDAYVKDRRETLEEYRVVPYHLQALSRAEREPDHGGPGTHGAAYVLRSLSLATFRLLHELGPATAPRLDAALTEGFTQHPVGDELRGDVLRAVAEGEFRAGMADRARAHLAESRKLHPGPDADRLEATWLVREGRTAEAATAIGSVLNASPDDAEFKFYQQSNGKP